MIGKNNHYLRDTKDGTKVESYSIKKFKVGAASVVIGASIFLGAGAVAQASEEVSNNTTADNTTNAGAKENVPTTPVATAQPVAKETTKEDVAAGLAAKLGGEVKALDKTKLENYIAEIEAKLANGTYANKTEESVAVLEEELKAAKATLADATTQDEITKAYSKLVTTVNTKLKAKPVEKKETPAVDTTNGKETVGKKAENTEKKSDSNSIENTGSNDPRNGKALDKNNGFRAESQNRSAEGKDIKFEFKGGKRIVDGDPTQRAKIEYRQLDDYEVVNGKTVPTDPSGQGRPVLEWTVTFNEAQYDKPGGFWYFSIPKNVSDPYNVITEYDGGGYTTRTEWNNGDGNAYAEGKQFIDDGSKLESRVKLTTGGGEYDKIPGLNGVMANSKKLYVLQTNIGSGIRKFTVRYRTVVEDPSQTISYIAGVQAAKNLAMHNWYAITGKYDKELVSQVDAPNVTPNLTNTSVNVPVQTVDSTSSTLSGTGTPGATIKLYIDGKEQNIGNVTVDSKGNWTTGELPTALNNNQGDGTTIKPRQTVQVSQVVNGEESSRRTVPVSVGETTVEPSSLTTNQAAVVAGQKEVTLKVPHDAGIAYMSYTNTAGETAEIPVKRDDLSAAWTSLKPEAATVKSVEHGKFQDTIVLTMKDKIAGTEVSAISNVVEGGFSSVAGWKARPVENQAPTIASAVEGNTKTVTQGAQLDLASLVTVADKEDDAQATLGDKVHAEVISVNGDAGTKTVDTNTQGTYTVKYKAVDSQGKESDEIEVTVVVNAARENKAPTVEIPYSDSTPNKKEIYLYNGEEADVDITFNDDSGKIKSASLRKGGNIALNNVDGNPEKQDNEWGYTVTAINSETATPAKIKVTGQVSGIAESRLPKTENDSLELVTRYATATDTDGAEISNNAVKTKNNGEVVGTYLTDPGAVTFVLKAQTKKYDIKTPASADKVTVSDANKVTDAEFEKIKEKVKVEYSQNNPDARLADKKGQEVEDASKVVDKVEKDGNNVVVTYKDGSKDTKPLSEFVNVAPKVELPYSNEANKQIYVYTGENTDLTFKATDNTAVKDMYVRGPGGIGEDNTAKYGFTTGKIENSAVTHGDGTVSGNTATIKMTGVTTLTAPNRWTSFVVANDNDNAPSTTDFNALDVNPNATQTPGYVQFIVKSQTDKYDIATPAPADKVEVADPTNVTDAELDKIKEKLKLEYNKKNDDANISKDSPVDKDGKIQSVTKDDKGNLVVTYKDGSKDTKPLSEFVTKKSTAAEGIKDPAVKTPVKDPANLTDAEKAKVAEEVKKANPTATNVEVGKDGTATVTLPDGTTGKIPADKTVEKAAEGVKDPAVKTPVQDPANLTDAEKAKVAEEVKKANPTATNVEVGKDGTATVTLPDGTTGKIPAAKTVEKAAEGIKDPAAKTPVQDPANLTDAEKAKVAEEVKKANPTATNVEVGKDGTATVTLPDGTTGKIPAAKTVEKAAEGVKDPAVKTPVKDPANLTDAEKAKVAEEVKKANPTATNVEVGKDGTATVTLPDGTTGKIPAAKTVEKAAEGVKDPAVKTPVKDPANLTDAEKAKVAEEVKKANPTATNVEVGKDGTATVTLPDGTTGKIPAAKTVEKAAEGIKDPAAKTPVQDPANLTDAEKAKVAEEVKKANPTATNVEVGKDGTATVTLPDGTTGKIPAAKTVEKAAEGVKDPAVKTPVKDPANLTDAEKAKVAEEVKKANPTATNVEVGKDGTATVTLPDGTTGKIPADKTVEKAAEGVKDPAVKTPVKDPANLTDAEKAKVAEEVKKANPTATNVEVGKDGTATVTLPDGTTGKIPAAKTVEKAAEGVKDPAVKTPVKDPANLTDAEKAKVAEEVKKANPTATNVEVGKDGTATVTLPDGTTGKIPAAKTVEKAAEGVKDPAVKTPVKDPANLTDAEKAKVAEEVKKANPTATNVEVGKDGTATVTLPDGTTGKIPAAKTVEKAAEGIKDPAAKTPVQDPANLTDAEKAKVAEEVKKANPTATNVEVGKDGTATVTLPDGTTGKIPADKTVEKAAEGIKDPAAKTPVQDPANLTDAEKAKVAEEVKKANPTATNVEVGKDGTATVTLPDGTTGKIPADKTVEKAAEGVKDPAVKTPADKTVVKDPAKLTDEEKAKVKKAVEDVNPGSKVAVDDKGNATVTTPEGKTAVIPATDLTKPKEDEAKPKAGNDIVKPADKTVVTNPDALTPEEKKAIEDKVKDVNPGSKVVVDDKGNATVTTPEGKTAVIPATDLTKPKEDEAKPKAGNDIVKPADKTVVTNPDALTPEEKKAIEDKVKDVNPGSKVVVDDKGNATVTTPEGKTAVIPATDLTKPKEDEAKPKAGNDIVKPADKTVVTNPDALTPEEKKAIEDKVKDVNPGSKVVVDDKGNATVTTPEGKTAVIPATDLTKPKEDEAKPKAGNDIVKPADKTVVTNPDALTPEEKKAIEDKVKDVNPGSKVVVDDKGNATVTTPEGKTAVIPATDLTKPKEDEAKPKAGNDIVKPADKTVVTNPDALTPEEKKAIEDKVKDVNPGSKVVVDDKGNATVTTPEGKTAVIPATDLTKPKEDEAKPKAGNDIVKPADKTVVTNPDALTPEEKKAIEDKVKDVNPGSKVVVDDKGNATVTTPEGKTAVIPATDLTKPKEDEAKPKAGNDIVKPADKTVVTNPDALTPEEKKAIEDKVKDVNPGSKVVVDDKGNATVTTPEGKTAVIPATDLTKPKEDEAKPKAGNDIVKPADKTVVTNPDALTPEEKKAIEDKVKDVNPGSKVVVDDKGNATVTTPEGKTAVIPATDLTKPKEDEAKPKAGNDIVKPADKTVVTNPDALTPEEKKAIEDKVKDVNPGSKVVVDDKGNATVTTPEGKTAVIPATDLTKPKEDEAKPKAGNDIVKPADKTVVTNPDALTPEEKKAIEDKVKDVNPGSKVVVDDKGNATVTTPEGKTAVIPATDLTKPKEDEAKPKAGNDIVKPADKTVVTNPDALTPEEKKAIEDKVKDVNPGSKVVVDDKGNATVTTPEGKTAVIPATDLTKPKEDEAKPKAGNDIVKPADKTVVTNPDALTPEEKKAIEDKVKDVNPGSKVVVDDKGNATVTTPEGKTAVIPATDLTKPKEDEAKPKAGNDIVKPADKTVVTNPDALTPEEKKAIEDKVKDVNPGSKVVVDDKGNATVTTPEGKTAVIPATDLTKPKEDEAKPKAGNDINTPADKTVVKDPAKLTDEEKAKVKKAVEDVNPGSKVVVDDKGNATVTTPEGKTAVIPATDLTKSPEDAAKPEAGNDINTPAGKVEVKDPAKLTDEEKAKVKKAVEDVNPGSKVVVDDKGNATVTTPEGKTTVIPATDLTKSLDEADKPNAGNTVNTPAGKVEVKDPAKLTDEEKAKVKKAVEDVNPGSKVVVDDKGNATVTTPEGKTVVIPATDLTKSSDEADKPNAGNTVNTPAGKVEVKDPAKLTDEEKAKVKKAVEDVNPGSKVVVDNKGNATVTTPEGKTAVIPATDLTKSPEEAAKPEAGNDINTPADKAVVKDPANLTPEEKKAIEDKVKAVNPGATVAVDDKGNATVTTPEGKTAVIPATDLTKSPEEAAKPEAGNNVNKPADKAVVKDPANLTDAEKKAIEDKVKAVNPEAKVVVDDKGNATVTPKDGEPVVIPATDLVKSPEEAAKPNAGNDIVKPAAKTEVKDPAKLTDAEKKAIEDKVKAVNPGATVAVDDKGNATVTTPEGKTAVIPATDLTKLPEEAAKPEAGNDINTPAGKVEVKDSAKLTDEEKAKVKKAVEDVNPGSKVVVDDKGNATVTTPAGKTAVIPATDLTKSPEEVAKPEAGNDINTPAGKVEVKDPAKLTDEEKAKVKKAVEDVNPGSKVVVDDKGNATVTTPAGKTAVIPATDLTKSPEEAAKPEAGNDINTPAGKVEVKDPAKLTDEEKAKVKKAVEDVNPGSKVVVDDKGNATVTTPEGKTAVIPAADVTKSAADADKANAGNAVNTPAGKVEVKDPAKLTDEEKAKVKKAVEDVNPGSKVVVDDKGNATVTTPEGKTAVVPGADVTKSAADADKANAGNAVNTPAGKVEVKDPAKLTDEEKAKVKKAVEDVNPGSKVVVDDKGNATVTTPEGKTATIPGADVTKSAADADKANAGNAVNTPAGKVEVKDPAKLTDEEKAKVKKAVEDVNPGSKVVVDDKGNATVTTPEGKTATIPGADVTKSAADADKANAGNAVNTPAGKVEVKDPAKLTDEEKAKVKKAVEDVNPGSKVVVDDKGNATVTTPEGKTATIPAADVTKSAADAGKANAGNAVNTPAGKVEVKDPAKLTDEEKAKVKKAVEDVNPGSKVVVDDKGNATVTTPEGKTATIPGADVTKSAADAGKANAGNAVNTPAGKVEVKDPAKLTDEEKAKVKKAVEDVNPGSKVVVDDKGNATVTTPEGKTAVVPAADVTKSAADAGKANAGNAVNTPATRVLVGDKAKLTADEIEKVKESIKAVNPGSKVVVDDKGNATVTTEDGKTATIPAAQLVKDAKDVAAKNNGENINLDFEKETVADFNNLTDAEKESAKAKIKGANADVVEVIFDKAGNATVITKDGKAYTIAAKDIFRQQEVPTRPGKVVVENPAKLTDAEKEAIKQALIDANPKLKDAEITIADNGEATIVYPDGQKVVIPGSDLVEAKAANNGSNGNSADGNSNAGAGTDANAGADATNGNSNAQDTNAKLGQRLANTGTTETNTGLAGLGLGILGGLLAAARRRKNDKN